LLISVLFAKVRFYFENWKHFF